MTVLPGHRVRLSDEYVLVMDFNAFCQAEEVTGLSFMAGELAYTNMRALRALVWAGLLHEHPDLTLKDAGDIITKLGMAHCFDAVAEAITAAMPEAGEGEKEDGSDSDPPSP
jgi:hypothetical protein